MLTELTICDKIECLANGTLQIRDRHQILKDGEEIAASFHRHVANPGDDVSGECERVKAIAAAVWTDDVIAAYQASLPAEPMATEPESDANADESNSGLSSFQPTSTTTKA
jgi:hypothetical protein